jgi:hypothetical protein
MKETSKFPIPLARSMVHRLILAVPLALGLSGVAIAATQWTTESKVGSWEITRGQENGQFAGCGMRARGNPATIILAKQDPASPYLLLIEARGNPGAKVMLKEQFNNEPVRNQPAEFVPDGFGMGGIPDNAWLEKFTQYTGNFRYQVWLGNKNFNWYLSQSSQAIAALDRCMEKNTGLNRPRNNAAPAAPQAQGNDAARQQYCSKHQEWGKKHIEAAQARGCRVSAEHLSAQATDYERCMKSDLSKLSPEARGFEQMIQNHCAKQSGKQAIAPQVPTQMGGDKYIAIAFSETTGTQGTSWGLGSQAAVNAHALSLCNSGGGNGTCKIVSQGPNTCGSIVGVQAPNGRYFYASATDPSRTQAQNTAMSICRRETRGAYCQLLATTCSTD